MDFFVKRNRHLILVGLMASIFWCINAMKRPAEGALEREGKKVRIREKDSFPPYLTSYLQVFQELALHDLVPDISVNIFKDFKKLDAVSPNVFAMRHNPYQLYRSIQLILQDCGPNVSYDLLKGALKKKGLSLASILNNCYQTVLHHACQWNDDEAVALLLRVAGDDVGKLIFHGDHCGWTAFHIAVYRGYAKIVTMLLETAEMMGKAYDLLIQKNNRGNAALHLSVSLFPIEGVVHSQERLEVINILINYARKNGEFHTFLNQANKKHHTAFGRANRLNYMQAIKILKEAWES